MQKAQPLPTLPVDPKAGDDAPSSVDVPVLIQNDLEVVKLYRQLSVAHDALVDYVMSKLKQQAD